MKRPEILAPAGSLESVIAAVNGGADAVYFGCHHFNARRNAVGMDEDEIKEAVRICHSAEVKVYVTLNILVKDSEMPQLLKTLDQLAGLAIDGLIVQDLGVIRILRKYFKKFHLQTSTQGSVYGLDGTLFYQELGFDRVVLPREMTLEEAAYIKKHSNVELKLFCHGALCYAYSGQCLMSSLIGGRSGNRGLCAQPCRKRYRLKDSEGRLLKQGYLLSMKDLNTAEHLKEIAEADMDALKIEGRMKSPEYVYGVSRYYKSRADGLFQDEEEAATLSSGIIEQLFNRDFTSGRLMKSSDVIGDVIGKNRGIRIGSVYFSDGRKLGIALEKNRTLVPGDGISFEGHRGTRVETVFNDKDQKLTQVKKGMRVKIPCRIRVKKGTTVWKTYDRVLMTALKEQALKPCPVQKKPIHFRCQIETDKPVCVFAESEGKNAVYTSDIIPQEAKSKPLDAATVEEQFSKLGDTEFVKETVECTIEEGLFLSRGDLNTLRKGAVAALEKMFQPASVLPQIHLKEELVPRSITEQPLLSVAFTELRQADRSVRLPADEIVLPVEELNRPQQIWELAAHFRKNGQRVLLRFPQILTTCDMDVLRHHWPLPEEWPVDGVLIANMEMLHFLKDSSVYKEADYPLNLFNSQTALAFKEAGVQAGVVSPELSSKEIEQLTACSAVDPVMLVYGRQEMMISANCVLNCKNKECDHCRRQGHYLLEDERGAAFPLWLDGRGITHIYNGDTLMLKEELIRQRYITKWRIMITDETQQTISDLVAYYAALRCRDPLPPVTGIEDRRLTKGNYKRGVE